MDFGEKKKKKEEESRSTGIPPLCELIRRLPALSIKCSAQSLTKCRFLTTFASFLSYLAFLIPLKIEMAASTGYHESLHFRKKTEPLVVRKVRILTVHVEASQVLMDALRCVRIFLNTLILLIGSLCYLHLWLWPSQLRNPKHRAYKTRSHLLITQPSNRRTFVNSKIPFYSQIKEGRHQLC